MIVPVEIRWEGHNVGFRLDLDDSIMVDHAVLHYLKQGQPCEPETCCVLLRALKEGDFAVDAGANVGFFTVLMSKLVGETGKVLAFEPVKANLARLRGNLKLNDCKNVEVVESPLWSSLTTLDMFCYQDGGASSLWALDPADRGSRMDTTTLDHECKTAPKLIKIDIEGAEVRALRGAHHTLKSHPIIITEMNESALERAGTSFEELRGMLRDYDCFTLSQTGHFPTYIPRNVEMVAARMNTNVMFATLAQLPDLWPEAKI